MFAEPNRHWRARASKITNMFKVNKISMSDEPASATAPPSGPLSQRSVMLRLSALQAANFAGIGIYMPFMPAWLLSQGLSEQQIGFTLAMGMIVRMLATQPIASLGDRPWGAARVLVLLQVLCAGAYLGLTRLPSVEAVMAAMACIAVLTAGVIPLGDHLTVAGVKRQPQLNFARMRLWGSVSFLVMSVLAGVMVSRLGIGTLPYALSACCLVAAATAALAPEERMPRAVTWADRTPEAIDPQRRVLLWLVIIASALINASHAMLYGFATLHWRGLGIDDSTIGVLWAVSVVSEIGMLWWFGRGASASFRNAALFLGVSGIGAVLRFAAMPFAVSLPAIMAVQALHAVSFGAQLLGVMAILAILSPGGRGASIQGRLSAVNACLMGAATLLSGVLYARFGAIGFLAMLPIAMAGLAILVAAALHARRVLLDTDAGGALVLDTDARRANVRLEPEP